MRLECPNCGAQYEVPTGVIPEDGRDVQCSNCSHTWFEPHPDALQAAMAPPPPPPPAEPEPTGRQAVDPAIADVLREEAAFEARAREAETAGSLESQPDLGLDDLPTPDDDATRRAREAQERMEARRGPSATEATMAATAAALASDDDRPRREQLPDIDDINATLRSSKEPRLIDRSEPPPHVAVRQAEKRRFWRGFMLMVLIAIVLVAIYVFAPRIADAVPQLAGPLEQYVSFVDQGRVWLDSQIARGLAWLDSMASETQPPVTEGEPEAPATDQ